MEYRESVTPNQSFFFVSLEESLLRGGKKFFASVAVRFVRAVKLQQFLIFLQQVFFARFFRQRAGFLGGRNGVVKSSGFGISRRQRPHERGFGIMSQFTSVFSQTHRLGTIAKRVIVTGRQRPRQVVQRSGKVRI